MKDKLYRWLTQGFGRLTKNRIIKPKDKIVKVNLGSGLAVAPGWYNIDANMNTLFAKLPSFTYRFIYNHTGNKNWFKEDDFVERLRNNRFYHHRLEFGIPFEGNSVDYVYSSHFFEHVFKETAIFLMKEVYRTLKPGGLFRLVIPDLQVAIDEYLRGNKDEGLSYFFVESSNDIYSRHYYMYDYEMIEKLFKEIGFVNVEKKEFQTGAMPDIQILDNRPEASLYVEAYKPKQ